MFACTAGSRTTLPPGLSLAQQSRQWYPGRLCFRYSSMGNTRCSDTSERNAPTWAQQELARTSMSLPKQIFHSAISSHWTPSLSLNSQLPVGVLSQHPCPCLKQYRTYFPAIRRRRYSGASRSWHLKHITGTPGLATIMEWLLTTAPRLRPES